MIFRTLVATIAALLLAVQVVRNAAVASLAERQPDAAKLYWAGHPTTQISDGMNQIAVSARDGTRVPPAAFEALSRAAERDPLAPEPFLVRGVQMQLAGQDVEAQRAFEAAQWRNPRSRQAAYFLADQYVRLRDASNGLRQLAILARLSTDGPRTVAPFLATYAEQPTNWPALRKLFGSNPPLAVSTLSILASKPQSAGAVLELAGPGSTLRDAPWLPTLLSTLTTAGDYGRARAIWAKAAGVGGQAPLHDAEFSDRDSPPPFNWALTSSAVGLAERQPGGRLHILYYGREDGILATQLLLLKPGSYRLSMQLLGDATRGKALNWSIWCDKAAAPISSATLDQVVGGWRFAVPSDCQAQWLKLSGSSGDVPQQVDATITNLKLERVPTGA